MWFPCQHPADCAGLAIWTCGRYGETDRRPPGQCSQILGYHFAAVSQGQLFQIASILCVSGFLCRTCPVALCHLHSTQSASVVTFRAPSAYSPSTYGVPALPVLGCFRAVVRHREMWFLPPTASSPVGQTSK